MTLLAHWDLIEADLHQVYGIDVEDIPMMQRRTWRWLRTRIMGLLDVPPVFLQVYVGEKSWLEVIPQTRIGYALYPPGRE